MEKKRKNTHMDEEEDDDDAWNKKLEKEDEIRKARQLKRNNQDFSKKNCCKESDIKLVYAHGNIHPQNNFELKKGYNVILLATYGQTICVNLPFINKLKSIYKNNKSIFENNDTDPFNYTSEGIRLSAILNHNCNFRLFIGGEYEVADIKLPQIIPNIYLEFGGSNCDNWGNEMNTDKIDYGCYIQCINQNDMTDNNDDRCEKYFFSNNFEYPIDLEESENIHNKKGIYLEELLQNEGKGTYIVLCCMEYYRPLTYDETDRYHTMVKTTRSIRSPAFRTRSIKQKIAKLSKELLKGEGIKTKKMRTKKMRTKKMRTKKMKTKKTIKKKKKDNE